jgi:hypothetical protein
MKLWGINNKTARKCISNLLLLTASGMLRQFNSVPQFHQDGSSGVPATILLAGDCMLISAYSFPIGHAALTGNRSPLLASDSQSYHLRIKYYTEIVLSLNRSKLS